MHRAATGGGWGCAGEQGFRKGCSRRVCLAAATMYLCLLVLRGFTLARSRLLVPRVSRSTRLTRLDYSRSTRRTAGYEQHEEASVEESLPKFMQMLSESRQECANEFERWKRRGEHLNHATPNQHRHNLCRGKALLYSEAKLFLGVLFMKKHNSLSAYVFDCLKTSNASAVGDVGVHDISVFARAVGPAIVFPRSHAIERNGEKFWKLDFQVRESGKYMVEVKARWILKPRGSVYLGGTERRTCDYCEIPRLLPHCENTSNVFASPQPFEFSTERLRLTSLPLSFSPSSPSAESSEGEPGRWINFRHACSPTRCHDPELFTGNPLALSREDTKMEQILPAANQTSRWFFQPSSSRHHMYDSQEIQECLSKIGAEGSKSVFVLGDSQARVVWGSLSYLAGLGDVTPSYLKSVKEYFKEKRTNGMITRVVEGSGKAGGTRQYTFRYIQEWTEAGSQWWDGVAEKAGLSTCNVSVMIYNAGFAHKSGRVKDFLAWWEKRFAGRSCKEPAKYYLSSVALQGQRNQGWDVGAFREKDGEYRRLFQQAGWQVIDAWEPTQSVGVDTTGEGGADGFHFAMAPTMNMVAMIFYNMLCNARAESR